MSITSKNISVVLQGSIKSEFVTKSIDSIIKFLPEAEIIISTWPCQNIPEEYIKKVSKIIINTDPGGVVFTQDGKIQNHNRQILSTKTGIKATSRKYVLKLRSDMLLTGTKFLDFFNKFPETDQDYKIFKSKILINNLYTRDLNSNKPFLFHPSDWVSFGYREDMLKLWDIPLTQEPEFSRWFVFHPTISPDRNVLTRYHAEQYIWISAIKKAGYAIDFENWFSYTPQLAEISERFLINNFVVLNYQKHFTIVSQKYPNINGDSPTLTFNGWLDLYCKYLNVNPVIPFTWSRSRALGIHKDIIRLRKHFYRLKAPFSHIFKWCPEPVVCLLIFIRIICISIFNLLKYIFSKG